MPLNLPVPTFGFVAWVAAAIVFAIFLREALRRPPTLAREEHHRGPRLTRSQGAVAAAFAAECKRRGQGLPLVSGPRPIYLSIAAERSHMLVQGSTGRGKTTVVGPLIEAALARGDRVFCNDPKGDYLSRLALPPAVEESMVVLDPSDARGVAWSPSVEMSGDPIRDDLALQEWAASIMPSESMSGQNAYFYVSAANVLCWCAQVAQQARPGSWTLADLVGVLTDLSMDRAAFIERHRALNPQAAELFSAREIGSIMSTLNATSVYLRALGRAWAGRKLFSFRRWVIDDAHPTRLIIARTDPELAQVSAVAMRTIVRLLATTATGSALTEEDHRLWLILDEFSSLPKLPGMDQILARGRSRGVRVCIATQTVHDWESAGYSKAESGQAVSNINTIVVAGSLDVDTQTWAANLLGKREINIVTHPGEDRVAKAGGGTEDRRSVTRTEQHLVMPADVASFGERPDGTGIRAGVRTGFGSFIVDWPWWQTQPRRPQHVAIDFTAADHAKPARAVPAEPAPPATAPPAQEPPAEPAPGIHIRLRRPGSTTVIAALAIILASAAGIARASVAMARPALMPARCERAREAAAEARCAAATWQERCIIAGGATCADRRLLGWRGLALLEHDLESAAGETE